MQLVIEFIIPSLLKAQHV